LEEVGAELRVEFDHIKAEKERLEFILATHLAVCEAFPESLTSGFCLSAEGPPDGTPWHGAAEEIETAPSSSYFMSAEMVEGSSLLEEVPWSKNVVEVSTAARLTSPSLLAL